MAQEVSRRDFLARLGVTVSAAAAGATAGAVPLLGGKAEAQPKGNIPDTPYKIGHMTFFTGAAAVLGEPSYKGHILAAEEINSHGGHLERQYAGPRARGRGVEAAHDLRGRLHGLPLRQGRAEPALHLSHH